MNTSFGNLMKLTVFTVNNRERFVVISTRTSFLKTFATIKVSSLNFLLFILKPILEKLLGILSTRFQILDDKSNGTVGKLENALSTISTTSSNISKMSEDVPNWISASPMRTSDCSKILFTMERISLNAWKKVSEILDEAWYSSWQLEHDGT